MKIYFFHSILSSRFCLFLALSLLITFFSVFFPSFVSLSIFYMRSECFASSKIELSKEVIVVSYSYGYSVDNGLAYGRTSLDVHKIVIKKKSKSHLKRFCNGHFIIVFISALTYYGEFFVCFFILYVNFTLFFRPFASHKPDAEWKSLVIRNRQIRNPMKYSVDKVWLMPKKWLDDAASISIALRLFSVKCVTAYNVSTLPFLMDAIYNTTIARQIFSAEKYRSLLITIVIVWNARFV